MHLRIAIVLVSCLFLALPAGAQEVPAGTPADAPEAVASPAAEPVPVPSPSLEPAAVPQALRFPVLVLDPNGRPVPGARVEVPSAGQEAVTDKDGRAFLTLAPGTVEVHVHAERFADLVEPGELDEATAATGLELMLEYPMGDVVVTGTRVARLAEQAPVRTQVVAREAIEEKHARNLADTLEQNTGVRVEMDCQNCGFTQIRMNGLEGQYTQILVDGRPVVSSLASVYIAEQIPEEMIERVEIVKGGGSALYGGNAVGGVVNIITRKPTRNFGDIQFRGSAVGLGLDDTVGDYRLSANGGLISPNRRLSLHVFAGATHRDAWDANGDGFSEIGRVRQIDGGAAGYLELVPGGELQLKTHFLREARRGGDHLGLPEHDAAIAESIRATRLEGDARWKHQVGRGTYELGYSLAYTERDSYYGAGGDADPGALLPEDPSTATDQEWEAYREALAQKEGALRAYGHSKNLVHLADVAYTHLFSGMGQHILTAGSQFQVDQLEDNLVGYDRIIDQTYWNIGVFAQHNWIWADWGEWVLGLRLDKHSEVGDPVVSPRLALQFRPLQWLRLRTAFGTGFRAPQVFDEDLHITIMGGEGQVIRNDPDLEPERSYSVSQEIGAEGAVGGGWTLKGGMNGFVTILTDLFQSEERDDPATVDQLEFLRTNGGRVLVYGGEASFGCDYRQGLWSVDVGVTVEETQRGTPDPDFGSRSLFRTPAAYGFLRTAVKPVKGLEISTVLDVTGPMDVPHYAGDVPVGADGNPVPTLVRSPWFFDWDVTLSYRWQIRQEVDLTLYAGVRNLLNSYQKDLDVGAGRDAGFVYGPREPRMVHGGMKVGF